MLRVLRGLAVLAAVGLAGAAAWAGLQSAGFRLRWDLDPSSPPTVEAPALREAPPPSEPLAATDAADDGEAAGDPPSARGPLASGRHERIEFETYPDGRPVASNSPVAEEWREQGLVVSFDSYTADATRPHVLDARGYLPANASMHALSFPLAGDRGLEVGVIHLDFPGRPRRVTFTLFGPDLIDDFEVIAWSGDDRLPASARAHAPDPRYASEDDSGSGTATYSPGGRSLFRAERVRIEAPLGVDRISLDGWGPPGHVLLVDHLEIDP